MNVSIDCDRRLTHRGSKEYEGGWYYYKTPPGNQPYGEEFETQKSRERWETFAECRAAVAAAGHELDIGGWKQKMLSWHFSCHALQDYPGWETKMGEYGRPAPVGFAKLVHRRRSGKDVESGVICNDWDNVAATHFYQRDWTSSGIPFCSDDETYWSGWWFATATERDRFLTWVREKFPETEVVEA